jgi:hypothetical protein
MALTPAERDPRDSRDEVMKQSRALHAVRSLDRTDPLLELRRAIATELAVMAFEAKREGPAAL